MARTPQLFLQRGVLLVEVQPQLLEDAELVLPALALLALAHLGWESSECPHTEQAGSVGRSLDSRSYYLIYKSVVKLLKGLLAYIYE